MIASLHGALEWRGSDGAVVRVGGVGFRVYMPTSTLSALGDIGDEVDLHTHLHFREDNVALYGFASAEELGLFQDLISTSGVGPKLALAILSAMNAEQLTVAIASGDIGLLSQIPGVGKKTAGRLVLELKSKLERGWIGLPALPLAQDKADVVAALTSLGYSAAEASRAAASLPDSPELSLEEKVKLALQQFGAR